MAIKSLAWVIFVAICIISVPVYAEQLEVPGTGACETILKELAFAFNEKNRENEIIIPPSVGSGGGIRLISTGAAQLARVARSLNEKEKQYSLKYLIFAKDPIVFAVGNKVGVNDLSAQQLGEIFSGKYENWQEVGGNNQRIRLLIREPQDSSLLIIKKSFPIFKDLKFSEKAKILFHDYEMVNALNKYSTVIGWLTNSSMKEVKFTVKAISVDGIKATRENIVAGKYKLISDYAFVYKEGELSGLAKKFVGFVFSEKGRMILSNAGMVPVDQQE